MIWLPGVLSQGGKKYTWNRYAIAYGEVAGTAATVSRTYNYSKYASSAYTIQNGVFVLTNPVATTFENLTAGKRTADIADSTNSVSSGSTLYKVTSNSGRLYIQMESSGTSTSSGFPEDFEASLVTAIKFDNSTGMFSGSSIRYYPVLEIVKGQVFYSDKTYLGTSIFKNVATCYKYLVTSTSQSSGFADFNFTRTTLSSAASSDVQITYTPYTISQTRGDLIDTVTDRDPAAYPENGIQDGYWYVLQTA